VSHHKSQSFLPPAIPLHMVWGHVLRGLNWELETLWHLVSARVDASDADNEIQDNDRHEHSNQSGDKELDLVDPGSVTDGPCSSPGMSPQSTKLRSVTHQDKDSRGTYPQHSASGRQRRTHFGGAEFMLDGEASAAPTAVPASSITGSTEDVVAGRQVQMLEPAVAEKEIDTSMSPARSKSVRSFVSFRNEETPAANVTKVRGQFSSRRESMRRHKVKQKSKLIRCQCVAMQLAALGAAVSRASQCIKTLTVCADYGTDLPLPLLMLLESLAQTCATLDWQLDSLPGSNPPAPNTCILSSLFWRPYMWRNELDAWLRNTKGQLRVLESMAAATVQGLGNLAPTDHGATGWELPAIQHPRVLVSTAKRVFAQSQNIPLRQVTSTAVLTSATACKAGLLDLKHAVLFSLLPTGKLLLASHKQSGDHLKVTFEHILHWKSYISGTCLFALAIVYGCLHHTVSQKDACLDADKA
jgi:hypothetical protein